MLFFFPRDVLDEILDLIGSVPEGFPTYSGTVNNLSAGRLLCTVKSIKTCCSQPWSWDTYSNKELEVIQN